MSTFIAALALSASADTVVSRGAVFRGVNDAASLKIVSDDELEYTRARWS